MNARSANDRSTGWYAVDSEVTTSLARPAVAQRGGAQLPVPSRRACDEAVVVAGDEEVARHAVAAVAPARMTAATGRDGARWTGADSPLG